MATQAQAPVATKQAPDVEAKIQQLRDLFAHGAEPRRVTGQLLGNPLAMFLPIQQPALAGGVPTN